MVVRQAQRVMSGTLKGCPCTSVLRWRPSAKLTVLWTMLLTSTLPASDISPFTCFLASGTFGAAFEEPLLCSWSGVEVSNAISWVPSLGFISPNEVFYDKQASEQLCNWRVRDQIVKAQHVVQYVLETLQLIQRHTAAVSDQSKVATWYYVNVCTYL